jgi:hypothetical protein
MYLSMLSRIRGYARGLRLGELFSSRRFLGHGARGSVDQAIYLLIKEREIVRVARGIFMRCGSPMPSVYAVAKVKAEAFGKRIFKHGADCGPPLGFPGAGNSGPTFACTGGSSHFLFGDVVIRFRGLSPRKLRGETSLAGAVIRAMWHSGKQQVDDSLVGRTYRKWSGAVDQLRDAAPMLPWWINGLFFWGRKNSRKGSVLLPWLGPDSIEDLEMAALLQQINERRQTSNWWGAVQSEPT